VFSQMKHEGLISALQEVKYFQNLPIAGTSDGLMAALFLDEAQVGN